MTQLFDITGKTALITGGAGLLGVQHAIALRDIGAHLVLTDINTSSLEKARASILAGCTGTGDIHIKIMDVGQKESIQAVANELEAANIYVDILINNAAIDPKVKGDVGIIESSRLEHFPLDDWNFQIQIGLTGAFLCSQIFGYKMAEGKGGNIVNIASDLAVIAPDQRLYKKDGVEAHLQPVKPVTYSVIKFGLLGLTKYLSTYWPNQNVRCNALSPGGVFNGQDEVFLSKLEPLIPMGRMAKADEYRGALQFLCSDASTYMNGHNLIIDGGRSVL